jgi:hypothetical protein
MVPVSMRDRKASQAPLFGSKRPSGSPPKLIEYTAVVLNDHLYMIGGLVARQITEKRVGMSTITLLLISPCFRFSGSLVVVVPFVAL